MSALSKTTIAILTEIEAENNLGNLFIRTAVRLPYQLALNLTRLAVKAENLLYLFLLLSMSPGAPYITFLVSSCPDEMVLFGVFLLYEL